jgi:hypothetical protein
MSEGQDTDSGQFEIKTLWESSSQVLPACATFLPVDWAIALRQDRLAEPDQDTQDSHVGSDPSFQRLWRRRVYI